MSPFPRLAAGVVALAILSLGAEARAQGSVLSPPAADQQQIASHLGAVAWGFNVAPSMTERGVAT
jgi:hypothetical protein